jgi:hypothetical protein
LKIEIPFRYLRYLLFTVFCDEESGHSDFESVHLHAHGLWYTGALMAASTEGTDLKSWIANREAFRQQAKNAVEKLEECQRRLAAAVGNRRSDASVTFSDETVAGIVALTQEAVTALQAAEAELPQIASAREDAESALESTNRQMVSAMKQRAQKEAEAVAQRKYDSRKRQSSIKRIALRLAAIGILLATFFVLYKY